MYGLWSVSEFGSLSGSNVKVVMTYLLHCLSLVRPCRALRLCRGHMKAPPERMQYQILHNSRPGYYNIVYFIYEGILLKNISFYEDLFYTLLYFLATCTLILIYSTFVYVYYHLNYNYSIYLKKLNLLRKVKL